MDSTWIGGLSEKAVLLHLVDLVLAVSLLELLWLLLRRPAAMRQLLPNLLAGLSLSLALRLALGGAGLAWIAPCLAAAGAAHLLDLQARRPPSEKRPRRFRPTLRPRRPEAGAVPSSRPPETEPQRMPTAPRQGLR